MSAFELDGDDLDDLDEGVLEVLAELSEEDLAELTDEQIAVLRGGPPLDDEDPLAGYARSVYRPRLPPHDPADVAVVDELPPLDHYTPPTRTTARNA